MTKYKIGDKVTVEIDGAYGIPMFVDGVVRKKDGELMVKITGYSSGVETENVHDYESQHVSLDEILD
jgi:hypothetical protein